MTASLIKDHQSTTHELELLANAIIAGAQKRIGQPPAAKEPVRAPLITAETPQQLLNNLNHAVSLSPPQTAESVQFKYYMDSYFWDSPEEEVQSQPANESQAEVEASAQQAPAESALEAIAQMTELEALVSEDDAAPEPQTEDDEPFYAGTDVDDDEQRDTVLWQDPEEVVSSTSNHGKEPDFQEHAPAPVRTPGVFVRFGPYEIRPAMGYEVPFGRDYQPVPYNSISRLAGYIGLDEYSLYIREVPDAPEYGLRPSRNGIWVRQAHELQFRRLWPGEAERITSQTEIRVGGDGVDAGTGLAVQAVQY